MLWAAVVAVVSAPVARPAGAAELATEFGPCREYALYQELIVYKEPSAFLALVSLLQSDPRQGLKELLRENPVLRPVEGTVKMQLAGKQRLKHYRALSYLYSLVDPRFEKMGPGGRRAPDAVEIRLVRLCGSGEVGFVLDPDLIDALQERPEEGQPYSMPPSVNSLPPYQGTVP